MPSPSPKTARELCALVESVLSEMPEKEQKNFWLLITENDKNKHYEQMLKILVGYIQSFCGITLTTVHDFVGINKELSAKLKKHRRPAKNAARDAEIMRLHREGKTAGQIVGAMENRFKLTDKIVNTVISRERRKLKAE